MSGVDMKASMLETPVWRKTDLEGDICEPEQQLSRGICFQEYVDAQGANLIALNPIKERGNNKSSVGCG